MLSVSPGTLFPSLSPPKDFDHFVSVELHLLSGPEASLCSEHVKCEGSHALLHLDPFLSVIFQSCCIFGPEASVQQAWYRLVLHPMSWPDQVLKDKTPISPLKSSVVTYQSHPPVPFPFYKLGFLFCVSCQQMFAFKQGREGRGLTSSPISVLLYSITASRRPSLWVP